MERRGSVSRHPGGCRGILCAQPVKISATIITLNEERNLARAIESLRCADEILVVDSGSTDRTVDIAQKLGARVVESEWHGYANQKNFAAEKVSYDWILSVDADESLSEALEAEIWKLKKSGPEFEAYTMPRLAQYLGRWIRHSGWYPDRKIRLYDRRKTRLEDNPTFHVRYWDGLLFRDLVANNRIPFCYAPGGAIP